jgi:hypothetical protein
MNVICLEDDAFYALVDRILDRIKERSGIKEDKWISGEEAMQRLWGFSLGPSDGCFLQYCYQHTDVNYLCAKGKPLQF